MRLPFARYLIAGSSKGAITEPGDAEMELPGSIIPIVIAGVPIDETRTADVTAQIDQSFLGGAGIQVQGVTVAQDLPMQRFGKGMWHIQGRHVFQFSGTPQPNALTSVGLTDKTGLTPAISFISQIAVFATNLIIEVELWLMLREDGTRFRISTPAIIAGDAIHSRFLFLANKLW